MNYIRVVVDGVIVKNGSILMIKREIEPFKGFWVLPGGHVEYGETIEKAVVREMLEETGLRTKIVRLLGVYSDPKRDPRYHAISVVFMLKIISGKIKGNYESSQINFFKKPPAKIGFDHRITMKDAFKMLRSMK